jgi:hypothetical protein
MMARVYGEDGLDMAPEFVGRAMNYAMGIMLGLNEWSPPEVGDDWTPEERKIVEAGLRVVEEAPSAELSLAIAELRCAVNGETSDRQAVLSRDEAAALLAARRSVPSVVESEEEARLWHLAGVADAYCWGQASKGDLGAAVDRLHERSPERLPAELTTPAPSGVEAGEGLHGTVTMQVPLRHARHMMEALRKAEEAAARLQGEGGGE